MPTLRISGPGGTVLLTGDREAALVFCAHPLCADAATLRNILREIASCHGDGIDTAAPESVVGSTSALSPKIVRAPKLTIRIESTGRVAW